MKKPETLVLEDFTPYHKSFIWKYMENYYTTRGKEAWLDGEVPYYATSNSIAARQKAELVYSAIELMETEGILRNTEPINILEMASGLGLFAVNFINAFRNLDRMKKKNYISRLKYYFTDYSPKNLKDANQNITLKKLEKEGVILFAELNALEPEKLKFLSKNKFEKTPKMAVVIANYMHVVLPVKILWKKSDGYYEKYLKTSLKITKDNKHVRTIADFMKWSLSSRRSYTKETDWRKIKADFYDESSHKKLVETELANFDIAKVIYPYGSFTNIEKTLTILEDNGIYLISDAAFSSVTQMVEAGKRGEDSQGKDRLTITVNMPFLESFAKSLGCQVIRTDGEYDEIQAIMIEKSNKQNLFPQFNKLFVDEDLNRDASDFYWAGNKLAAANYLKAAIRVYNRALKFQPEDADIYYQLGITLTEHGEFANSLRMLKKGIPFNYFKISDFDFGFGYAYQNNKLYKKAIEYYKKSLINKNSEITLYNIGLCYEKLNKVDFAIKYYQKSLNINPKYPKPTERLSKLNK